MLKQRVITAVLALIVVLAVLMFGGTVTWRILVWVGCLLGGYEFAAMLGNRSFSVPSLWVYIVITVVQWYPAWHTAFVFEVLVSFTLALPVMLKNRLTYTQAGGALLGALYIGYGGQSLVAIRELHHGLAWLLLFLVATWATDTVAFFVGRALKGPKLWPSISPQKTLSGGFGGIIGGIIGAVVVAECLLPHQHLGLIVLLGAVISLCGQLGDFVESGYKRASGVKDSGNLLPGHGGLLDRVDSLLYAAPFVCAMISSYLTGSIS